MSLAKRKAPNLTLNFRNDKNKLKNRNNNNDALCKNRYPDDDLIYANSSAREFYDCDYNPLPLSVIELNEARTKDQRGGGKKKRDASRFWYQKMFQVLTGL